MRCPFRLSALLLSVAIAQSLILSKPLLAQAPPTEATKPAAAPKPVLATQASPLPDPNVLVGPLLLRDVGVGEVLDLVERWTGRILLRPASLPPGTYALTLDKPLPKAEALRALETLLNMNGVGLSPLGDRFLKVTPLNLIRTDAPDFIEGSTLGMQSSGRIVAKIFSLDFLRAAEFVPQISRLLNPALGAEPVIFEKNNSVLLTDSLSNLQRIEQLLLTIDRPASSGLAIKTYNLEFAKASDIANKLRTLLSGALAAQIGATTTYQPDDRTNQLLLISDPREQAFFDSLVSRLDVKADPSTRSEVIFLKHANAIDVEALLGKLISGQNTTARSTGGDTGRAGASSRRTPGATPAAPTPATPAAVATTTSPGAPSEEFSSLLTIVADERSNAIIVAGTPDDIRLVASLVNRIDVLLAQVRIEIVVAEVTLSNDITSGIDSLGLRVDNNKLTGFTASGAGASIGAQGAGTSSLTSFATSTGYGQNLTGAIGIGSSPRKDNTAILSVPSIVTSHNKKAEIFVGETRPVISGTTSGSSGSSTGLTTSSSVTQQKIGIRLTVLPLIGNDGSIQLEITQVVEDILGKVIIDGNEQPIVGERTTESFVSAKNGDIIVLGGLQRANQGKTTSSLGPIPFLGDLFGKRSYSKGRTELIFFLRPTVLTGTTLDNVEALKRIDSTSQAKEVRAIIDTRPAAASATPAPAAVSESSEKH
ncbi:type II secretory pathway, component PulD [Verrucomicrobia bacterium IMCC26134]|nr:type II secretory pathway, component PulD [Verrucomicrobia bacterium IMCC26134]